MNILEALDDFKKSPGVATVITPINRPKSFRNRCIIEVFGGVFVLSRFSIVF